MGLIKSLNKWANARTYLLLDLIRIMLGIIFFVKGIEFMTNFTEMERMARPFEGVPGGMFILHYIAPAHFVGGILIVVGLLTRWACIAQLPILFGAVLTNFWAKWTPTTLCWLPLFYYLPSSLLFMVLGNILWIITLKCSNNL